MGCAGTRQPDGCGNKKSESPPPTLTPRKTPQKSTTSSGDSATTSCFGNIPHEPRHLDRRLFPDRRFSAAGRRETALLGLRRVLDKRRNPEWPMPWPHRASGGFRTGKLHTGYMRYSGFDGPKLYIFPLPSAPLDGAANVFGSELQLLRMNQPSSENQEHRELK